MGIIKESCVKAMGTRTSGIPLNHDGLHVVIQNASGDAAKGFKGVLVAGDQRLYFHIGDKLDKTHPTVAEGRTKGVERVATVAKLHPVDLHLLAGRGLKPHYRLCGLLWFQPMHISAKLTVTPQIALCLDLAEQYRRRYPRGMRGSLPLAQVIRKRGELGGARRSARILWPRFCDSVLTDGIHRASDFFSNLSQTHSLLPQ